MMNIKCDVIVDAWLGQKVLEVVKLELFYASEGWQPSRDIPVQVFVANRISILRGWGDDQLQGYYIAKFI